MFVDRVLFLGRLCNSFTEQCPNIKLVMGGGEAEANKGRGTPRLVCIGIQSVQMMLIMTCIVVFWVFFLLLIL